MSGAAYIRRSGRRACPRSLSRKSEGCSPRSETVGQGPRLLFNDVAVSRQQRLPDKRWIDAVEDECRRSSFAPFVRDWVDVLLVHAAESLLLIGSEKNVRGV